jgi:hypothetical protein
VTNLTENVIVAELNIYGERVPVGIEVRGTYVRFHAVWNGDILEADSLAALEAKLKVARRTKRVPWNLKVKVVSGSKLVDAIITGKHATNRNFLVKTERSRWGEVSKATIQMHTHSAFYLPDAPSEAYSALRAALREAESQMQTFNKLWRVDPGILAGPTIVQIEEAAQTDAPLPDGPDEPEPLSVDDSKAALDETIEDEEAADI